MAGHVGVRVAEVQIEKRTRVVIKRVFRTKSSSMNLYFQLFTQEQSAAALQLLQFPMTFSVGPPVPGRAKMSAGGKISALKFADLENLIGRLDSKKFNELEVTCS